VIDDKGLRIIKERGILEIISVYPLISVFHK